MKLKIPLTARRRTLPGLLASALAATVAAAMVVLSPTQAVAIATPVPLATAASFSVLAGAGVTNTGPTVIGHDLGTHPNPAITGFPPGEVLGAVHAADAVALQAKSDLVTAYNNAAGQATDFALAAGIGNGTTLLPGVYTASSGVGLTGDLILDARGNPNSVWVFQIPEALTTASSSRVLLTNGASPCNVYWQIGSSATLGTNSTFVGTIMALTDIHVTTGTNIEGRALARNGAVTLDTNRIFLGSCSTGTTGGTTAGTTTGTTTTGTTTGTTAGTTAGTTTAGTTAGTTTAGTTTGTTAGTTAGTTTAGTTTGTTAGTTIGTTAGTTTGTTAGTTTAGTTGGTSTGGLTNGTILGATGGGVISGGLLGGPLVTGGAGTAGNTAGNSAGNSAGNTAGNTAGGGHGGAPGGPGHGGDSHQGKPGDEHQGVHGKPGHGHGEKPDVHNGYGYGSKPKIEDYMDYGDSKGHQGSKGSDGSGVHEGDKSHED
ncbi:MULTISPECIES: ice-binding family protein [Streptomyces]|uniref:Ice-binding family protein n=1 Tax=Streptomyces flaveolus TaxID=67297 RepID=A0ABV3A8G8_9ACTN|nr:MULTISPECIES: ice-binding family protein [Streptomyces]KMS82960.1 Large tegument protein [Streptomyces regensis]